ncbi:MAG: GNAT family N-acetyltransferase [Candidatus Sulfotelmatobacter sp.]
MEALVRRAVPEDAEAIAALQIRSWQIEYRGQLPDKCLDQLGRQLSQRSEVWQAHISTPPTSKNEIWVVDTETRVDAFAAIGPAREADPNITGELDAIYVDPDRWRQGLGRALFTHATGRLKALGYSTAILWVLESNARARRFYEIAGWSADGGSKLESRTGFELREVSYRILFHREKEGE